MKLLSENDLIAVVLDDADKYSEAGIELIRHSNAFQMHQGKKRLATVVRVPEKITTYTARYGMEDKVKTTPCQVKELDRVLLSRLAGVTSFMYQGEQVTLVHEGEIRLVYEEGMPEAVVPERLKLYVEQIKENQTESV